MVDAGGCLLAFARMDDAWRGSVDIAISKAWTARAFDVETKALAKLAQPGTDFYGIHASNDGKVAAALMDKADELFSEPPQIHKFTLLAAK